MPIWQDIKEERVSQQILSGKLLLTVTNGQKYNFKCEFKLKAIITYLIQFVVKVGSGYLNW